jgi:hypothetical protein
MASLEIGEEQWAVSAGKQFVGMQRMVEVMLPRGKRCNEGEKAQKSSGEEPETGAKAIAWRAGSVSDRSWQSSSR